MYSFLKYRECVLLFLSFLLLTADWDVDEMADALAAILDQE